MDFLLLMSVLLVLVPRCIFCTGICLMSALLVLVLRSIYLHTAGIFDVRTLSASDRGVPWYLTLLNNLLQCKCWCNRIGAGALAPGI